LVTLDSWGGPHLVYPELANGAQRPCKNREKKGT
jgi:hypothetical protein